MKFLVFCVLVFTSLSSLAEADFTGWRFGAGFGQQSEMNSLIGLDLGTPVLYKGTELDHSLVFALTGYTTMYEDSENDNYSMFGAKVMWEIRRRMYKELISYYSRLGAGWMFADNALNEGDDFFIVPFYFGVDIATFQQDDMLGSFFIQVGFDLNFENDDTPVSDFSGTQTWAGIRLNF
jgi:hypothetical protein